MEKCDPKLKTHWFRNECSSLTFSGVLHRAVFTLSPSLYVSVVCVFITSGRCAMSEQRFFSPLSLSPLKMPRLVSSPGVYRTESAFLVSYKRLLTPEPNRSALPLRPRTRCVINGEQLQWKGGSTFNKVENVYPVKPEAGRREFLIPSTSSTLLTATSLCFFVTSTWLYF